jgi:hypothetical protein
MQLFTLLTLHWSHFIFMSPAQVISADPSIPHIQQDFGGENVWDAQMSRIETEAVSIDLDSDDFLSRHPSYHKGERSSWEKAEICYQWSDCSWESVLNTRKEDRRHGKTQMRVEGRASFR